MKPNLQNIESLLTLIENEEQEIVSENGDKLVAISESAAYGVDDHPHYSKLADSGCVDLIEYEIWNETTQETACYLQTVQYNAKDTDQHFRGVRNDCCEITSFFSA